MTYSIYDYLFYDGWLGVALCVITLWIVASMAIRLKELEAEVNHRLDKITENLSSMKGQLDYIKAHFTAAEIIHVRGGKISSTPLEAKIGKGKATKAKKPTAAKKGKKS